MLSTESLKNSLAAELIVWLEQLFLAKKKVCEKNGNKLQRCISTNTSFSVDALELYSWIWVVLVNIQKVKTFASTMRLNNCFLPLATVDELLASQSQSLHVISLYVFSLKLVKGNICKIISLDCLSLITSFCVEHIKCGKSHNGTD